MSTPGQPNPNLQPPSGPPSFNDQPTERIGQQPGQQGTPPGQTPGQNPGQDNSGGKKKLGIGAVIGIAIACLVVAGAAGYYFGNDKGKSDGEQIGYNQGKKEGLAEGKTQGAAQFAPGTPGYKKIYDTGFAKGKEIGIAQGEKSGKKSGQAKGKKEGEKVGYEQGKAAGEQAASKEISGGYTNWLANTPYLIVGTTTASAAAPFSITQRHQMVPNYYYYICNTGTNQVCRHTESYFTGN